MPDKHGRRPQSRRSLTLEARSRWRWVLAAVALTTLAGWLWSLQLLFASEDRVVRTEFLKDAEERELIIREQLVVATAALESVWSFYDVSELVTREEFDVQTAVLARTREKVEQLEARVSALAEKLEDS